MKVLVINIVFILLLGCNVFAQNTARVTITKGSRVQFFFESYYDIEHGKTLGSGSTGYTTIDVYFKHSVVPSTWYLDIRSNNAVFQPDFGTTTLPLDYMTMDVYLDGTTTGNYTLTNSDQQIATASGDYSAGANHTVTITYNFAKSGQLIGINSDNFSTDIIVTLHN